MTKPMSLLSTQLDQIRTISSESDDSNGMPLEFQSSHLFFFFLSSIKLFPISHNEN